MVRDGEESTEVTLVTRTGRGYASLTGRPLGPTGEAVLTDDALLDEVIASSVRLPASRRTRRLNQAAREHLSPLPGWTTQPHLRHAHALALDEHGQASIGAWRLTYDEELGLLHEELR